MSDAERDAWLREALRHAPDAGAAPPPLLSDAILAKARAAAAEAAPRATPRHAAAKPAPPNGLLAFWAWLARPPVAAGFASVMAATLVGLMWWDRPMDQTVPAPAFQRAPPAQKAAPSAAPAPAAPPTLEARAGATPEASNAQAPAPAPSKLQRAASPTDALAEQSAAPKDKSANERDANAASLRAADQAADGTESLKKKRDAPAPFPATEFQRSQGTATAPLVDAKKESATTVVPAASRAAPTSPVPLPAAAPPAAATTPTPEAERAPAPAPIVGGRLASDESRRAAANSADAGAAKSLPARPAEAKVAAGSSFVRDAASPEGAAAAAAPLRQRETADVREKEARAFAPSGATANRSEPAPSRLDAAPGSAAPLAPLLAALARDATHWSRQGAAGTVGVEPAWRDWLAELDAATVGGWRSAADATLDADAAKASGTTLRLYRDGRLAASVRLDGTTVRVDAQLETTPEHWQAPLPPAAAERLRAALARLPP
jgi:hypothetical protein